MKDKTFQIRHAGTTPADLVRPGEPKSEWYHVYEPRDDDAVDERNFVCAVRVIERPIATDKSEFTASTPDHSFSYMHYSYEAAVHGLLRYILQVPRRGKTPSEHARDKTAAGTQDIAPDHYPIG